MTATWVSVAHAEPNAADKETARVLMADGRAKRAAGDHKAALEAFKKAHAIMNVPTTGLEVAREQEALGLLTDARDTYLAVSRMDPTPGEAKVFGEARKEAAKLAEAIAPRIPSVTLTITGVPDAYKAKVTIDGSELNTASLGVPRKIDPGKHDIVVTVETLEKKESVELAEAESKDVTIAFTAEEVATLAPPKVPAKFDEPPPPPIDTTPPPKKLSPLVFVGFGLAGAGLVAGSVTGLMSLSKASSAKSSCIDNKCPPSTHDDISSSKSLGTISTISFALAGVGLGLGLYGLLSSKPAKVEEPAAAKNGPTVSFWVGYGSAGMTGAF